VARTAQLILLPPSEGKAVGGDGAAWAPGSMHVDLDERRVQVIAALRRAMRANAAARGRLLGVKGEALAAATRANRELPEAPTMAAIDRYSGVLYGALDAATLDAAGRRRLSSDVLIVSGLWGLVAPDDPIPAYKLKMGASLPRLGKLSTWWRPAIDAALGDRGGRGAIWNLLPKEHDAAWSGAIGRTVVQVRFLEPGARGELVAVAHWNKFLKGALVRWLLEHPGAGPDDLARWRHPSGFVLDPARTRTEGDRIELDLVQRG
jgi:cytoplasmic iron level regulating protein YaaA (DUF328/UPF0246 family)